MDQEKSFPIQLCRNRQTRLVEISQNDFWRRIESWTQNHLQLDLQNWKYCEWARLKEIYPILRSSWRSLALRSLHEEISSSFRRRHLPSFKSQCLLLERSEVASAIFFSEEQHYETSLVLHGAKRNDGSIWQAWQRKKMHFWGQTSKEIRAN